MDIRPNNRFETMKKIIKTLALVAIMLIPYMKNVATAQTTQEDKESIAKALMPIIGGNSLQEEEILKKQYGVKCKITTYYDAANSHVVYSVEFESKKIHNGIDLAVCKNQFIYNFVYACNATNNPQTLDILVDTMEQYGLSFRYESLYKNNRRYILVSPAELRAAGSK